MPQLSLLEPGESVLVDDVSGRIPYTPGFLDEATGRPGVTAPTTT